MGKRQLTYWEQIAADAEKKKADLRALNLCVMCFNRGENTPALHYNGLGWGYCQPHAEEHQAKVLADWSRICGLVADVDYLHKEIKKMENR